MQSGKKSFPSNAQLTLVGVVGSNPDRAKTFLLDKTLGSGTKICHWDYWLKAVTRLSHLPICYLAK